MKKLLRGMERGLEDLMRLGRKHNATEPLEIRGEILEHLEDQVSGGLIPDPALQVTVTVESAQLAGARELFRDFERQVRERLRVKGCLIADEVAVRVTCRERRDPATKAWVMRRLPAPRKGDTPEPPFSGVWLIPSRGRAQTVEQPLLRRRINLGRCEMVSIARRPPRQNHVWFDEAEDTVSRSHAHIEGSPRGFILFDDGSRWGTRVVRNGEELPVARGAALGLPLRHGDVIELGKGCAIEFRTSSPALGNAPAAASAGTDTTLPTRSEG